MKNKRIIGAVIAVMFFVAGLIQPFSANMAEAKGKTLSLTNAEGVVDFAAVQAYNPDIYAWIVIPNTKVNYPVVQSVVDDYYIMRNVDGSKGYPGALYTNRVNTKTFQDFNTVIYGHNMKNKTAFGSLHYFDKADFFNKNQDMYIYTADGVYYYQIYSTVKYSNALILDQYPNALETSRQEYINLTLTGYAKSKVEHVREGVELTTEDKLVTLSTCINDARYRYLVIAKQISFVPYK
jgi:sortase B